MNKCKMSCDHTEHNRTLLHSEVHLKLQIMVDIYMYYTGVTGAYYMFYKMLTSRA